MPLSKHCLRLPADCPKGAGAADGGEVGAEDAGLAGGDGGGGGGEAEVAVGGAGVQDFKGGVAVVAEDVLVGEGGGEDGAGVEGGGVAGQTGRGG